MNIDGLTGVGGTTGGITPTSQLTQEDFFTLLTTQLRSQNPLEPMEDQEFMGELAQFANLEQTSRINDNLLGLAFLQESLAGMGQLTQGAQLIGHNVEYADPNTGERRFGRVEAVRLEAQGVMLDLGSDTIPFGNLTAVVENVSEEDASTEEEETDTDEQGDV